MKLSEIPDSDATPAPGSPGAGKTKLSQVGGGEQEGGGSWAGDLFRGFVKGFSVDNILRPPSILPGAEAGRQKVEVGVEQQAAAAQQRHPAAATIGQIGGGIAAAAPLMAGPAGATLPARVGLGAARGALGAAMAPPTTTGDYWGDKLKMLAAGTMMGGAIPAAGGALAPAMPNIQQFAANAQRAFPALRNFLFGVEERTIDGFDRSFARQVLEPIGGDVARNMRAGHGLIDHVYRQADAAYDAIKPQLSLNRYSGQAAFRTVEPEIQRIAGELHEGEKPFLNFVNRQVIGRFDQNGVMDGDAIKAAQSELAKRSRSLYKSSHDEVAQAYDEVGDLLRKSLMAQNPSVAPQLQKIDHTWAMLRTMARAASREPGGKFSPSDLWGAISRSSSEMGVARGKPFGPNDVSQAYAEMGTKVLQGSRPSGADLAHAFLRVLSPEGMATKAARATQRGVLYPLGRGAKTSAPVTTPIAGRYAEPIREGLTGDDAEDARERYDANRRGDLTKVRERLAQ